MPDQKRPPQLLFYTESSAFSPAVLKLLQRKGIVAIKVNSLDDVRLVSPEPWPLSANVMLRAACSAIRRAHYDETRLLFAQAVCDAIAKETTNA